MINALLLPIPVYDEKGNLTEGSFPRVVEIEEGYEAKRDIVGGLIERFSWNAPNRRPIDFWINEEGKVLNLQPSAVIVNSAGRIVDYTCGNVIAIPENYDEELGGVDGSLTEDEQKLLLEELCIRIEPIAIGEHLVHYAIRLI